MNEFQKRLEEFRTHYDKQFGRKLDDETLYFFIRVNEMQLALQKQINKLNNDLKSNNVAFRTSWDYFLYGVGKITGVLLLVAILASIMILSVKVIFPVSK